MDPDKELYPPRALHRTDNRPRLEPCGRCGKKVLGEGLSRTDRCRDHLWLGSGCARAASTGSRARSQSGSCFADTLDPCPYRYAHHRRGP
jgi:hypothetical protein